MRKLEIGRPPVSVGDAHTKPTVATLENGDVGAAGAVLGAPTGMAVKTEDSTEPAEVASSSLTLYGEPFGKPETVKGDVSGVPGVHSSQVADEVGLYHTEGVAVEDVGVDHVNVIDWSLRETETEGRWGGSWTLNVFESVHPATLHAWTTNVGAEPAGRLATVKLEPTREAISTPSRRILKLEIGAPLADGIDQTSGADVGEGEVARES
jgi:hypothetical protein